MRDNEFNQNIEIEYSQSKELEVVRAIDAASMREDSLLCTEYSRSEEFYESDIEVDTKEQADKRRVSARKKKILKMAMATVGTVTVLVATDSEPRSNPGLKIPSEAVEFNGHYYCKFDELYTWDRARIVCEEKGGHLVTISNNDENEFVHSLVKDESRHTYWIGASDEKDEGVFQWVSGERWDFTHWSNTQPDNYQGDEHYVEMYAPTGFWNDASINNSHTEEMESMGYICEWDYTID